MPTRNSVMHGINDIGTYLAYPFQINFDLRDFNQCFAKVTTFWLFSIRNRLLFGKPECNTEFVVQ